MSSVDRRYTLLALAVAGSVASLGAQAAAPRAPGLPELAGATNVVVPQCRSFHVGGDSALRIEAVRADIAITEQAARTTLTITLRNPTKVRQQTVVLLPVPDAAAVSELRLAGRDLAASIVHREEARDLNRRIVRGVRDPALLEFHGSSLLRSASFGLPPETTQHVRLTYEHVCPSDGRRTDYALPRSESLEQTAPWDIRVEIRSQRPVDLVYSPSHEITKKHRSKTHASVRLKPISRTEPGPFLLSYLTAAGEGVQASLFAYPDPGGGNGYFLLLAGVPARSTEDKAAAVRDVAIVLDRSGSMAGAKMEQARNAALRVIDSLRPGERFRILDYGTTVESFSAQTVLKDDASVARARAYLRSLQPSGGTNIHDALAATLAASPAPGTLPIALFLTDGLPTVGTTSETLIRDRIRDDNPHAYRVFTFGVGHDVNVPLLDRVAELTRATATYVLPAEDVDSKVAQVFNKLWGPALTSPELVTLDAAGEIDEALAPDREPSRLPDLFGNDRIIVLGRYLPRDKLRFRLAGESHGEPRQFEMAFDLSSARPANAFVARLWASRRIATLVDRVRQRGAARASLPLVKGGTQWTDRGLGAMRDEILRLSTRFGILSEYTSFLGSDRTGLADWNGIVRACQETLESKAIRTRSGKAAFNQACNIQAQKGATKLNLRNSWLDEDLKRVESTTVRQVRDRAFFKRGGRWIDSRLVLDGKLQHDKVVELGSREHGQLLERLAADGRQAALSLSGDVLVWTPGGIYLVRNER